MDTGETYIGNPHLSAVKYPAAVDFFGSRLHTDDVGTGRVFRHGQGTDLLAGKETREDALLLFRVAVQ